MVFLGVFSCCKIDKSEVHCLAHNMVLPRNVAIQVIFKLLVKTLKDYTNAIVVYGNTVKVLVEKGINPEKSL